MSQRTDELHEKMLEYFNECVNLLSQPKKPGGPKKKPASLAALCKHLGITKTELADMEHGTADEQRFYSDMMLEYELAVDEMLAARMLSPSDYTKLKATLFDNSSTDPDNRITVVFENWNAPNEYEDFLDITEACESVGLELRHIPHLIRKHGQTELAALHDAADSAKEQSR